MKRYATQSLIFPLILVLCLASENRLLAYPDKGTVITVNDVGDTVDAAPGDGICADDAGKCTLRAAIMESNTTAGSNAIIFDVPVPAVINLTLGELLVTKYVSILGRGARSLTIQRTTIPNSSNFRVFHLSSSAQLRGLTIQNGNSFGAGGGILAEAGLGLTDVAIKGNRAISGGGIAFQGAGGGPTGLQRCLIISNMTTGQGGGIFVAPGMSALVLSSTLTNNSAADGGAIANFGSTTLVNDTITRNSASQSSSSILSSAGHSVGIINTIIGPDIGQTVNSIDGQIGSDGSNIVTNSTGSTGWIGSDQISPSNGIDPMLGSLGNNGGQTDSFPLLSGSPAIDRGDDCVHRGGFGCGITGAFYDLLYDQRKNRLPTGTGIDIGAYETGSTPNASVYTNSLFFGRSQRLFGSKVTVTDVETMEKQTSFISMWDERQMREGGSRPFTFRANGVYVAEIRSKRGNIYNPLIITELGY